MNDLVQRLSLGQHPLEISRRPQKSVAALREALDRRYVHVRLTETRGGTELGVPIDPSKSAPMPISRPGRAASRSPAS